MQNCFDIKFDDNTGGVLSIRNLNDQFNMNWCEGKHVWGTVKDAELVSLSEQDNCMSAVYSTRNLKIVVSRFLKDNGNFAEKYTFTNTTDTDVFFTRGSIGIYATFNDSYESAKVCMTNRCHTHIWCGGNVSYINALKMGLSDINLGLVLTHGSLDGYSIERNPKELSNDRGDFILHPSPFNLSKGESYTLSWELFWHTGNDDFYSKLECFDNVILFDVKQYTVFENEKIEFIVNKKDIEIYCDEKIVEHIAENNISKVIYKPDRLGEHKFIVDSGVIRTFVRIYVVPELKELVKRRIEFIVEKQQFHKGKSPLDGAYLIYDNEDKCPYFDNEWHDHNASRERLGMGILIARYLQSNPDEKIQNSLNKYITFVKREFLNEDTGEVFNTIGRYSSFKRLYNAPWMAIFMMELFRLTKDENYLELMVKILKKYYKEGGAGFYANGLSLYETVDILMENNKNDLADELTELYGTHVENIMKIGINYPKHEVNFEQTIVTPVVMFISQFCKITGNKEYIGEVKKQIDILERFNGLQPDYHLYEIAIRHWDDYWFGKRGLLGDTFPHYWSSLTAVAYFHYYELIGDKHYYYKAQNCIRDCMCLFNPDGSASCAYVYPYSINGIRGEFYDEWANDQDFALYFMMKFFSKGDA